MRRCPFRVNKSITKTQEFSYGHDIIEVNVIEEYPYCMTDCAYHNDKNGKCMRVALELTKVITTVHEIDDME